MNGAKWYNDGFGVWDPDTESPVPRAVEHIRASGVRMIRYPGGTSSNLFDWRAAIGPQDQRRPQVEGQDGEEVDSRYGPDEYMQVMKALGATPQIMAPFVGSTPDEIAAWVAYMNAPQGNTWGDLRAANGHPEPYGVRDWEIGNELFGENQRYWMSRDTATALRQYAFGGTERQVNQEVGTPTDHRHRASHSTGAPDQVFAVHYPPVVPGTQTVRVGRATWSEVDDLDSAGPYDPVYAFDADSGTIRFGDGKHGRVPRRNAKITADYDSGPHAGFVDYYAKMKAVDPHIRIYAVWAPVEQGKLDTQTSFPALLADEGPGDAYDGIAIHPYTNFSRDLGADRFPDRRAGHDYQMLGDAAAGRAVADLQDEARRHGRNDALIAVSESGALFFGGNRRSAKAFREYAYAVSHALYMASQWVRFTELGVPWTAGNDMIGDEPGRSRSLLGGPPDYIRSVDSIVREQLKHFFQSEGHVTAVQMAGNPEVHTRDTPLGSSYDALLATAAIGNDGSLRLVVVNRSPEAGIATHIKLDGFRPADHAEVSVVTGHSYHDAGPVAIDRSRSRTDDTGLEFTFAAHSVTLLRFTPLAR
ncbi:hypothetical protein O7599_05565 [Streptomyces sp. WMMC500]|uniref:hypothetical protein n=1 Tax=Streptomyces sp. WMMC500 TaxID=3015154 RepID=UPI00248B4EDA|nr:hypothetical protein [Streptomyces sp. WMMC500]WBB62008.1 hypothetical protein O7599_05565 [Streptomyces sp. WMMC500]